jgi:DHA3 family macrolide efflux protein-like MFS transporter
MPRDYWYLWQGQLVSQMGTQAFQVLALFWLASQTHQAGAGALFLTCSLLPPIFFGPALARWSAQFAPRRVLVSCDALASLLALPVLLALVLKMPIATVVIALLVSNAMLALVHALMMPTLHASVPMLVPKEKLPSANSWMFTTQQMASVMGQGLGGLVYALIGPAGLCLVHMAGFAMSGILSMRMKSPAVCQPPPPVAERGPAPWSLLRTNIVLRNTTIVSAVFNLLYAPWIVLLPFHLSRTGTPDAKSLGMVLAGYGLGSLTGNLVLRRLLSAAGPRLLPCALTFQALALVGLGFTQGPMQTALALFAMGAGVGLVNVQLMTRIQTNVEDSQRAGAIAVIRASVYLAIPLGYGAVALAQYLGTAPGKVYMACGAALLGALLLMRRQMQD